MAPTIVLSETASKYAHTLGFKHPITGEEMDFSVLPPQDFKGLIEKWETYVSGLNVKL